MVYQKYLELPFFKNVAKARNVPFPSYYSFFQRMQKEPDKSSDIEQQQPFDDRK